MMGEMETMGSTRDRILHAACDEMYLNGFRGGSIDRIAARADATKGAVFHHFKSKAELGYAMVEEVIEPGGKRRWIDPLAEASDPVGAIQTLFRRNIQEDLSNAEALSQGCPLNNLAQEMSLLDEGFRKRIARSYEAWREALAEALERAKRQGQVKQSVSPPEVAALIVACQMGIWGTAKNSRSAGLMVQAGEALCGYLDSLRR